LAGMIIFWPTKLIQIWANASPTFLKQI
jgi:hypothetical protein